MIMAIFQVTIEYKTPSNRKGIYTERICGELPDIKGKAIKYLTMDPKRKLKTVVHTTIEQLTF